MVILLKSITCNQEHMVGRQGLRYGSLTMRETTDHTLTQ